MSNKKVSIIIPTFNEEEYLPACLNSILDLNYKKEDMEIIVIDNGSTDRSRMIAEEHGVKVLRDDSLNISGLRNLGARNASGDVLAFVDADCIVGENWLKNAAIYFEKKNIVAWGAPPLLPEESTWVQKAWYIIRQKEDIVQTVEWLESMNLFVRKELFLEAGGFNEDLVTCEDVDLCYRLQKYGKIYSDHNIKVIHLGEASTVREFMKKEIWRGQGNLKGISSHGFSLKEIPSLSIPLYFGILIPVFLVLTIITLNKIYLIASTLLYLLPTLAVMFKVRNKQIRIAEFVLLVFLIQIYFLSRTVAVVIKT